MHIYIYIYTRTQTHIHRPDSPCTGADIGIHVCVPVRIDGTSLLSDLFVLCLGGHRGAEWNQHAAQRSTDEYVSVILGHIGEPRAAGAKGRTTPKTPLVGARRTPILNRGSNYGCSADPPF